MSLPDSSISKEAVEPDNRDERVLELATYAESVVRVSFAGLGGAIIGLGQHQKQKNMRVLTGSALTAAARRKRSPMTSQLNMPWTMALSCMGFCALVETTRLTSPSSMMLEIPYIRGKVQRFGTSEASQSAAITISDFTIGGAVAGIAGSFGKTSRTRIPIAAFRGSGRFFGLGPGIALGLVAGSLQATADYSISYLETAAALDANLSSNSKKSDAKDN